MRESGKEVPSQLGSEEQGLLAWHRAGKDDSSLEGREGTAALKSIRDVSIGPKRRFEGRV